MLWDACVLSPGYPVHAVEPAQKWHPSALSYHCALQTAARQMAAQISCCLGLCPTFCPACHRQDQCKNGNTVRQSQEMHSFKGGSASSRSMRSSPSPVSKQIWWLRLREVRPFLQACGVQGVGSPDGTWCDTPHTGN